MTGRVRTAQAVSCSGSVSAPECAGGGVYKRSLLYTPPIPCTPSPYAPGKVLRRVRRQCAGKSALPAQTVFRHFSDVTASDVATFVAMAELSAAQGRLLASWRDLDAVSAPAAAPTAPELSSDYNGAQGAQAVLFACAVL